MSKAKSLIRPYMKHTLCTKFWDVKNIRRKKNYSYGLNPWVWTRKHFAINSHSLNSNPFILGIHFSHPPSMFFSGTVYEPQNANLSNGFEAWKKAPKLKTTLELETLFQKSLLILENPWRKKFWKVIAEKLFLNATRRTRF